jgi:hypothetical protein
MIYYWHILDGNYYNKYARSSCRSKFIYSLRISIGRGFIYYTKSTSSAIIGEYLFGGSRSMCRNKSTLISYSSILNKKNSNILYGERLNEYYKCLIGNILN